MNPYDVSDFLELRKLILVMSKEGNTDTTVVLLVGRCLHIGLIMHGRVDDFKELSAEGFLRMGTRGIYNNAV